MLFKFMVPITLSIASRYFNAYFCFKIIFKKLFSLQKIILLKKFLVVIYNLSKTNHTISFTNLLRKIQQREGGRWMF
jgi:hypothetical protein